MRFTITAFAMCVLLLLCGACASAPEPARVLRDDLMGTVMSITAYGDTESVNAAYRRIGEIHRLCDVNDPDSPVSRINASAGYREPVQVTGDLLEMLSLAEEARAGSGGAFDASLGELVSLWGIGTEREAVPPPERIGEALARRAENEILLSGETGTGAISLTRQGVRLDLGGIAKGYACDEAARILRESGVTSAILDLGGNVYAMGNKPDGSPWRIGLRSPLGDGAAIAALRLTDQAAVTSGSYERWFERDGVRYHHILDPATGYPADSGLLSVTIVYPEAALADAMSTACFVLGLEEGSRLVLNTPGMAAVFITEGLEVYTAGDTGGFALSDDRFTLMGAIA